MTLVAFGQTTLMSGDRRAIVLLSGTVLYGVIQGRAELRRRRAGALPACPAVRLPLRCAVRDQAGSSRTRVRHFR